MRAKFTGHIAPATTRLFQPILANELALNNGPSTCRCLTEIYCAIFTAGGKKMQVRIVGTQDLMSKNLKSVANILSDEPRIQIASDKSRNVHTGHTLSLAETGTNGL